MSVELLGPGCGGGVACFFMDEGVKKLLEVLDFFVKGAHVSLSSESSVKSIGDLDRGTSDV